MPAILIKKLKIGAFVSACQDGSESYDSCGQRCSCVGGRLVNCVRIRKEFSSMTYAERRRHISTIETVSTSPTFRPEYESLINEHYHYFHTDIHKKKHFLPWHRYYILRYENLLRKVDCTFTVAYWDWSLDSRDPFSTTNPEDVWHSQTGFGGNGEGEDHCVLTGPFRKGKWSRVRPNWAGPGPHCLLRDFWGTPPEEVCVEEVLRMNPFHKFELALRTVLHDNVHCNINGTMCTEEAASAPEFFLHHGFIDKIWHDWQSRSDAHKHAYFPSVDETMPSTTLFPAEMICLLNQPGGVAVEYEPFQSEEIMREEMKGRKSKYSPY